MQKNLFKDVYTTAIPLDPNRPSVQIGNFCFLIAGIELLLSCELFVKFIYFYKNKNVIFAELEAKTKSLDLTDICKLCQLYYEKNTDLNTLYNIIQKLLLEELGEKQPGQEDINVIFLYFEKNILYFLLFSQFQYVTCKTGENPVEIDNYGKKSVYSIYTLINNTHNKPSIDSISKLCEDETVTGAIILNGNHYEIYKLDNKKIIAKNTNYLLNSPWKTLTFICQSYISKCDLRILKLLASGIL